VQIVPDGADSHTFEPRPTDAIVLARADLLVMNGLHLEVPTQRLAERNMRPGAAVLSLGEETIARDEWVFDFSFPAADGNPNPHLWLNVAHAARYASLIGAKVAELDPANAAYYAANLAALQVKLDQLDRAIFDATETVPRINRRLLTYHDSWAYFAPRYGYTVIGAVQPSDFSEPSPREMAQIVDQIRATYVPAIFGSEVYPSKVLDAISRETGVGHVTTLSDDALPGEVGAREHTYVGMMVDNMRAMVGALGGDPSAFDAIDPGPVS
jgi:ABC-type Zn uptake system ZnuABC Zn-binding protein ZnuA